jgi:hypothetical protein
MPKCEGVRAFWNHVGLTCMEEFSEAGPCLYGPTKQAESVF